VGEIKCDKVGIKTIMWSSQQYQATCATKQDISVALFFHCMPFSFISVYNSMLRLVQIHLWILLPQEAWMEEVSDPKQGLGRLIGEKAFV